MPLSAQKGRRRRRQRTPERTPERPGVTGRPRCRCRCALATNRATGAGGPNRPRADRERCRGNPAHALGGGHRDRPLGDRDGDCGPRAAGSLGASGRGVAPSATRHSPDPEQAVSRSSITSGSSSCGQGSSSTESGYECGLLQGPDEADRERGARPEHQAVGQPRRRRRGHAASVARRARVGRGAVRACGGGPATFGRPRAWQARLYAAVHSAAAFRCQRELARSLGGDA
jgi:hypothetical protein